MNSSNFINVDYSNTAPWAQISTKPVQKPLLRAIASTKTVTF